MIERCIQSARLMKQSGLVALTVAAFSPTAYAQQAQFSDVTQLTGLSNYRASSAEVHSPGAVFTDLNNDGYPDLYLVTRSDNVLFINTARGGSRVFVAAPTSAGASATGDATGAVAADYDNDGDIDIYVINFDEPNILLQNQLTDTGFLFFEDTAGAAGIQNQFDPALTGPLDRTLTAAWGDVNRDGHLDLYVGTHDTPANEGMDHGKAGQRDTLYLSNGDGTFSDVTESANAGGWEAVNGSIEDDTRRYSSTNAVMFADLNNDGWPDLWVTNKLDNREDDVDMIYINQGSVNGVWQGFETITYSSGLQDDSPGAMGIAIADYDHDNDLDIYIADFIRPNDGTNDLYTSNFENGSLSFSHSNSLPGLFSWGVQWEDFDNNGWEDLHVATHAERQEFLYLNIEGQFTEAAATSGLDFVRNQRSSVSADYNRDGWLDLFVINKDDGPSLLLENQSGQVNPNHNFVVLSLETNGSSPQGFASSADAIGTRVRLTADLNGNNVIENNETLLREAVSGSSNAASTSSLAIEFGIGLANTATLEVLWPSGRSTTHSVQANGNYQLHETQGISQLPLNLPAPPVGRTSQLIAAHSGLCLAADNLNTSTQTPIEQSECGAQESFIWSFQPRNGALEIINQDSGLCLTVPGSTSESGTTIVQTNCNGADHKLWHVERAAAETQLIRSQATGLCLDVRGVQRAPGADVIQFACNATSLNQQWSTTLPEFVPDPNKIYHIDNPAHGLRLAARSGSEVLESAALSSTGENTQWRFVQSATSGLWHIQRAAGGNTPRIRTVLSTTPDMQATSSSGDWTRFSIEANASRPGTYLLTVPLANTVNQRLRLLANGTTDFSTNNNVGNNPSFVFTEVN